jgi:hypothetical protein
MGEKMENILYSLLPLILIIFVSWFFSFLGSRVKKHTEQATQNQGTEPEREAAHLFFDKEEAMESPKPAQHIPGLSVPISGDRSTLMQPQSASPQVSPKPIKPKWWGA